MAHPGNAYIVMAHHGGGLAMGIRIWILIAIDVLFFLGLLTMVFAGGGEYLWSIVSCIVLIAYVTRSIVQLMQKAKQPPVLPK